MAGWGDEISQYYVVESMMKLNPMQVVHLYDHAINKNEVETWLSQHVGEEWFWDNGQTWLDTWRLVLYQRGENFEQIRAAINDGEMGVIDGGTNRWGDDNDVCL